MTAVAPSAQHAIAIRCRMEGVHLMMALWTICCHPIQTPCKVTSKDSRWLSRMPTAKDGSQIFHPSRSSPPTTPGCSFIHPTTTCHIPGVPCSLLNARIQFCIRKALQVPHILMTSKLLPPSSPLDPLCWSLVAVRDR